MRMGRRVCRIAPLRVGFLRVGFRVGFFSRLGVAAAPVAGVLSVFFRDAVCVVEVSGQFGNANLNRGERKGRGALFGLCGFVVLFLLSLDSSSFFRRRRVAVRSRRFLSRSREG